MFSRDIYPALQEHLQAKQVTVLTGMRRTGKTTLVRALLDEVESENKLYLDLERIDNRALFTEENYDAIIEAWKERGLSTRQKMYIALDEIQHAPQAPSVIKYLYDHYDIKFIVTGSSSYYLKDLFSESLAGRKKLFELLPLDFGEFLAFKQQPADDLDFLSHSFRAHEYRRLSRYYEEFIAYGGFPEVVLTDTTQSKRDLTTDIISSYINIDVKTLSDIRNQEALLALMRMLAARVGSRLDYVKLSRLSGLSRPTVLSYVSFLEKTYVICRLPVWARRPDREIVKAKKIYFTDTGLLSALGQPSSGTLFENAVFNQLRHHGPLSYYARKTGHEIDFILKGAVALEIKETPTIDDQQRLQGLARHAGIAASRLIGRRPVPRFDDYIWGGMIR